MTLLGNFVRTSGQGEKSISWRSINGMNSMRSSARAISFLMRTLIHAAHASFAPFVLSERAIFSLSGHLYKISQQSHKSAPTHAPSLREAFHRCPAYLVKVHKREVATRADPGRSILPEGLLNQRKRRRPGLVSFPPGATAHDEAHNAFMTLPPYTRTREGEAPQQGSGSMATGRRPRRATQSPRLRP
jgi:hypothetical protein